MSSLLNSLAGKQSRILYKRYFYSPLTPNRHLCLLRFEVDGWSTVVIGIGRQRYLAGSRALQAYVKFCESLGLDYKDTTGLFESDDVDVSRWELSDAYYGEDNDAI